MPINKAELNSLRIVPAMTVIRREMFPEDSLGASLFPEELEGRSRPTFILEKPSALLLNGFAHHYDRVTNMGVNTFLGLLSVQEERLSHFIFHSKIPSFRDLIQERMISWLLYTPADHLVATAQGVKMRDPDQYNPPPAEDEQARLEAILAILAKADQKFPLELPGTLIDLSYGLSSWRPKSMAEIAKVFGDITLERIRRRRNIGFNFFKLRALSHPLIG